MTNDNYGELLEALGEVTLQRKELEAREKQLREALGMFFEGKSGTIVEGNYIFKMRQNPGRQTLNKAALEAAGIDLSPYYKVGKPFVTLSIDRLA